MSFYTEEVAIAPLADGRWKLVTDLVWEIGEKGTGYFYTVPAGEVTDLASIPRWAWTWFDRGNSRYAKAAILHDHMVCNSGFSPITASAEFAAALLADGVGPRTVFIMGMAVLWHNAIRKGGKV
ncbi:MAG: DUF1353 domain-containing protein [Nitratireductor sp.]|nr:DUF1353 domain-containing protein [Nitratireductor sp.]